MNMFLPANGAPQHVQALARCSTPEMRALLELFERVTQDTFQALAKADEAYRVHRLQGRIEVLKDFTDAAKQANSVLERSR